MSFVCTDKHVLNIYRVLSTLEEEEKTDSDRFLDECIQDPTLRDKLSILGRTFKNRKQVHSFYMTLILNWCYYIQCYWRKFKDNQS